MADRTDELFSDEVFKNFGYETGAVELGEIFNLLKANSEEMYLTEFVLYAEKNIFPPKLVTIGWKTAQAI